RVAARLHFDRLVELERHFDAAEVVVEVGDVQTVDVERVLRDRRTADRDEVRGLAAERRFAAAGAGREQHEVADVAADRHARRQFLDVNRNTAGAGAERRLDRRGGDDDLVAGGGQANGEVGSLRGLHQHVIRGEGVL